VADVPQSCLPISGEIDGLYDQRRLVGRVLRHWTEIAIARGLPGLLDVDPWMIGDDWLNCLIVAVQAPVERSYFLTIGENLQPSADTDLTGAAIALCPSDTLAEILLSHLALVLSARRCLIVEGAALQQQTPILYRSALLPLSQNGVDVDHVLGAANYRALRPGETAHEPTQVTWADGGNAAIGSITPV
jgi:hypothetical protein